VLNQHREDSLCGISPDNSDKSWRCWRKDFPSKIIAGNLSIEVATVYWHLAAIRKAFGVHSNIELLYHLNEEPEASISTIRLIPRGRDDARRDNLTASGVITSRKNGLRILQ